MKFNKGAMFGLDARIALAIFGALSVISGAALYSAIQSAKAENWRQWFVELVKATEQYYLDNGEQVRQFTTTNPERGELMIGVLRYNHLNLSTWNGQYWSTSTSNSSSNWIDDIRILHYPQAKVKIWLRKGSDWSSPSSLLDEVCIVNSHDCYEWITLYLNNTKDSRILFEQLDQLIDNGDGESKGKLRYNTYLDDYILYQGMPHKRGV